MGCLFHWINASTSLRLGGDLAMRLVDREKTRERGRCQNDEDLLTTVYQTHEQDHSPLEIVIRHVIAAHALSTTCFRAT